MYLKEDWTRQKQDQGTEARIKRNIQTEVQRKETGKTKEACGIQTKKSNIHIIRELESQTEKINGQKQYWMR